MEASDLNLRHLHAIVATARSGSVSSAARAVNLTQPAVTQAIAKVENGLGTLLFGRSATGMTPTEAGRILSRRAEAALQLIGSSRVTSPQIRAFVALSRTGSYVAAASLLGMREPSLHRAVSDLSIGLGHTLVERRGRGVMLTARGAAFARKFRLAQTELSLALDELAALDGHEVGRIVIGAMPLSRAQLLPNAIGRFHKMHPDVDIAVIEGSHSELAAPLRDGDIDLLLGALRNDPPPDLDQEDLFVDRPVMLARAGHPLIGKRATIRRLASFPWVLPAKEAPLRKHWEQMFERSGVRPPRIAIECGSVLVVRQLLLRDDFLTLLSPAQVAVELEAGWLARLCEAPGDPQRIIGLICRSGWRPTPLQKSFITIIRQEAKLITSGES